MRDVIGHLIKILEKGGEAIVCQVVETRGSTPQKAGSMMIVDPDGGQGGTLGGGCVENEVKTKAIRQLSSGAAAVHSFVLDHDYAWADGLICGGRMVVIAQPVRGPEPLRVFPLGRQVSRGRPGLHRGDRARPRIGRRPAGGTAISVRRRRRPRASLPSGEVPVGLVVPDRKAGRAAETVGPRAGSRSCRAGRASG